MDAERNGSDTESGDQPERQRWTRQHSYGCLVLIAVLVAVIALIGVCNAVGRTEPEGVHFEPVSPTAVLQPTVTPSCPTPAEQEFFDYGFGRMFIYQDTHLELSRVMEQLRENPLLLYDEMWRYDLLSWYDNAIMAAEQVAVWPAAPPSTAGIRQDMSRLASLTREVQEAFVQEFLAVDVGFSQGNHVTEALPNFELMAAIVEANQFDRRHINRFCQGQS